jgi:hypothetical protein
MSLADSSYPLLNPFWTMFEFFLWVIWIWIMVFIDHRWAGRASLDGDVLAPAHPASLRLAGRRLYQRR